MTLHYWLLCFRGWTGVAVSDGALAILSNHLPQLQVPR